MRFRQRGTLIAGALIQGEEPREPRVPSRRWIRLACSEARSVLSATGNDHLLERVDELEEEWTP